MRISRTTLDIGLPLAGVVIILSSVLFLQDIRAQIAVVVVGIILIEAGIWKLAHQFLPNDRQFYYLRSEIDNFILLCRRLNTYATKLKCDDSDVKQQDFDNIKKELQECLDRITEVAGKTEEDIEELKNNTKLKI